jgi:hypothetical protein
MLLRQEVKGIRHPISTQVRETNGFLMAKEQVLIFLLESKVVCRAPLFNSQGRGCGTAAR